MGFGAGLVGVAAAFADLGEAGVGGGAVGVGGEGGLELLFGFGEQALGEVVAAELGVFGGALGGREGGQRRARIWSSWKAAWRKEASE